MRVQRGSVFDTELHAIGHGVNTAGVMGAGIAKPIKEQFPNNFSNYEAACRAGQLRPGDTMVVQEKGMYIFNIASQSRPGRYARYEWLFSAALDAARTAVEIGLDSIAIPMIGCGIGGLDWEYVSALLEVTESIVGEGFQWEVWIQ